MKAGFIGCGAGLMAKSMEDAGIEISWGVDINPLYLTSFDANFPKAKSILKSIEDFSPEDFINLPEVDIVIITLPCQSFSHANQKREEKPFLLYYSIYLLSKKFPKYFIIENVPNAIKYIPPLFNPKVFRMCWFGNNQKRERMLCANFEISIPYPNRKSSVPAVTKKGNGNGRFYEYTNYQTALERMGFKDKGLKLLGTDTEKKEQVGEGVVYELGYHIGKILTKLNLEVKQEAMQSEARHSSQA